MMKHSEGKKILKKDHSGLSFVGRTLKKEIEKEIEECLEKQEKELNNVTQIIHEQVRIKFKSVIEFQMYIYKHMDIKAP